jgi:DNA-binding response OmpR family regulator
VLLDVMLPEVDGFTICRELRKTSDVPIIFITARHSEDDSLHGYRLGCDDYVTKPFSLAELYAKATALVKRAKGMVRTQVMSAGGIKLNPYRCTAMVNDKRTGFIPIDKAVNEAISSFRANSANICAECKKDINRTVKSEGEANEGAKRLNKFTVMCIHFAFE